MPHDPHSRPPLEAFVARALRELPAERAPADLEARVQAALARRAVVPWWRQDWRAWPVVPRTLVIAAAVAVVLALGAGSYLGLRALESFSLSSWIGTHAPGLAALGSALGTLGDAFALCARKFQPWLLGLAVLAAGSYLTLVSLGAGVCRRLLAHR